MKIALKSGKPLDASTDLLILPVFAFERKKKGGDLPAVIAQVDRAMGKVLPDLLKREDFSGKRDQSLVVETYGKLKSTKIAFFGLGDPAKLTPADVRTSFAKMSRLANTERAKAIQIALPEEALEHLRAATEGLELGAYRFTKYFTGDRKPKGGVNQITLTTAENVQSAHKRAVEIGRMVGQAVNDARDLSNEPGNVLYPETFADRAVELAKDKGLDVKVYDYADILAEGMQLIQAVGQGSEHKPRLVHLTYAPAGSKGKSSSADGVRVPRLVFVGKGITFDSGGLSIKPAAGMGDMKHDMSGAANMMGLMRAVAELQPNVEVHAIIACAENMPDGNAYRPGDVWGSYEGKTVEIINTDAEGRLVLADALTYAQRLNPDFLLDAATLTGAMVVALGETCSGWYALDDAAAKTFQAAVTQSGEQMWRMPLLEELKDQLKSEVADLKHTGDRYAGSITAALFLREFIGETKAWVHCDIAGPAMPNRPFRWDPKGGSGHGVLTFLALVEQHAALS